MLVCHRYSSGPLGVRFALWISIAFAALTIAITQSPAEQLREPEQKHLVLPAVRSATDCIAGQVTQGGTNQLATDIALAEAIRSVLASKRCDEAILKMVSTYERVNGTGSGLAFFSGPYGSDLPRAVRARLSNRNSVGGQSSPQSSRMLIEPPGSAIAVTTEIEASRAGAVASQTPVLPDPPTASSITSAGIQISDQSRPSTPEIRAAERAVQALLANIAGIIGVAGAATFILFLIGLGSRWVVFANGPDLARTATIVLAPVATGLVAALEISRLTLSGGEPNPPLTQAYVLGQPTLIGVVGIGTLVLLWAFVTTFTASIRQNGLVMGISIATLRIVAALFTPIALFGLMHVYDLGRAQTRQRTELGGWILLSILVWFGSKLINGNRVATQRQLFNSQHALRF